MIIVINGSEGEYDGYYEFVIAIMDINTNKSGEILHQEYLEYSWRAVALATGINIDNEKRTNKERKEWSKVITKFFKEYSFENYLEEKYEGKKVEYTQITV